MNTDQIRARDAEALLANPVFEGAMKAMGELLDRNISSVNPDNKDQCARVVLAKQLLAGIEREIKRYISNGEVANLIELEAAKQLKVKERLTGKMVR